MGERRRAEAVIAYRGTRLTNASDLLTDAHIAVGREHTASRIREAKDVAVRGKAKYKDKLTLTGHSLGAMSSAHGSYATGAPAYLYNPGTGAMSWKQWLKNRFTKRNITTFRTHLDPISANARGLGGKVYDISQKGKDPHGLYNFF
jgi:hypothetical protein